MVHQYIKRHQRLAWFFCDKHGTVIISQPANKPLIAWFVLQCAVLLAQFTQATRTIYLVIAAGLVLAYWALLEIFLGVNPWRKTLGIVVYTYVVVSLAHLAL